MLKRWEEEGNRSPLVSVPKHTFTHREASSAMHSLSYLPLLKTLFSSSLFVYDQERYNRPGVFFSCYLHVYSGKQKVVISWTGSVLTPERAPVFSSYMFSKTSHSHSALGVVGQLGSWCLFLLLINHQLQALVLKNFLFPAHTHTHTRSHHHVHTHPCIQTLFILLFSKLGNEKQSRRVGPSSVSTVKPRLHGIVECNLGSAIKCSLFVFCLEQKNCLTLCGPHVQHVQHRKESVDNFGIIMVNLQCLSKNIIV